MDVIREKILKNWLNFLDESTKAREKLIKDFDKAISKLDNTVAEQRQATILLLKKALNLSDGDEIRLFSDGHYEIISNSRRTEMEENKTTEEKETVTLNGREVSKEEFERQKEAAASQKGAKLEEVSKGNYKMRLQG